MGRSEGSPNPGWRRRAALWLLPALLLASCASTPEPDRLDASPLGLLRPAAGFSDQRGRFREILCAVNASHGAELPEHRPCEEILHRFADEPAGSGEPVELGVPRAPLRVALVSGLGAECFAGVVNAFSYALEHLRGHGYRTASIRVDGLSSSAHNGRQVRDAVLAMDLAPGERLLLVGYSKGVPDILEGLVAYAGLRDRVAAVVSVAGAVGGSPLSDDAPESLLALFEHVPGSRCDEGDGGALASLSPATRRAFADAHPLPRSVRYFSLAAFAERDRTSLVLRGSYDDLARIDPRNDGQVLFYDQVIAEGALLGFAAADHWAIALPISREQRFIDATLVRRNAFPREVVLEAIVRHVEEQLRADVARDPLAEADPRAKSSEPGS